MPTPAALPSSVLHVSPLAEADIAPLDAALRQDAVFAHIGVTPDRERFERGLRAAIAGPQLHHGCEKWCNFTVRVPAAWLAAGPPARPARRAPDAAPRAAAEPTADGLVVVGRLEATLHDGIAEVAFLFAPQAQGRGLATASLHWLHAELWRLGHRGALWACTLPANTRSAALLRRCGYAQVQRTHAGEAPPLLSWDPGDWVFTRAMPAAPAAPDGHATAATPAPNQPAR